MPAGQCNLRVRKSERKSVNNRGVSSDTTHIACQGAFNRKPLRTCRTKINPVCDQTDDVAEFTNNTNRETRMKRGCNTTRSECDVSLTRKRSKVVRHDVGLAQKSLDVHTVSNKRDISRVPDSISARKGRSSATVDTDDIPGKPITRLGQKGLRTVSDDASVTEPAHVAPNESDIARKTAKGRAQESVRNADVSGPLGFPDSSTRARGELPTKQRRHSLRTGENGIADKQVPVTQSNTFAQVPSTVRLAGKPNLSTTLQYFSIYAHVKNSLARTQDNSPCGLSDVSVAGGRAKRIKQNEFWSVDDANGSECTASKTTHRKTLTNNTGGKDSAEAGLSDSGQSAEVVISSAESVKRYPRNRNKGGSASTSAASSVSASPTVPSTSIVFSPSTEPACEKLRVKWKKHRKRRKSPKPRTHSAGTKPELEETRVANNRSALVLKRTAKSPNKRPATVAQKDTHSPGEHQTLPASEEDVHAALLAKYATLHDCNFNVRVVLERLALPANQRGHVQPTSVKSEPESSVDGSTMSPVYIKMRSSDEVLVDMTNYHTDGSIKFDISSPTSSGCCTYGDSSPNETGIIVRRIEMEGLLEDGNALVRVRPSGIPFTPGGDIRLPGDDQSEAPVKVMPAPVSHLPCSIQHVKLNCTISPITPKVDEPDAADKYRIGFNNSVTRYVPKVHQTSMKPPSATASAAKENNQTNRNDLDGCVETPEPVHVELPVKSPVKICSKLSLTRADEGAAERETKNSADTIEEPVLGDGRGSEKKTQMQLKTKACQAGRKIRLKRNAAKEAAATAPALVTAVLPNRKSCTSPPNEMQPEISEGGVKTRSRSNVVGSKQIMQIRRPISFQPKKPLTEQETKSLLANIKSLELPYVQPTDKAAPTISLDRSKRPACPEVAGITKILRNKANQSVQMAKSDESLLIARVAKAPDSSQKKERAPEEMDSHPARENTHPVASDSVKNALPKELCTLSEKKPLVADISGVRDRLEGKTSTTSVGEPFAVPVVPARKRRRIVYDELPATPSAETVKAGLEAESESVKLTERKKDCLTIPDIRNNDVTEFMTNKEESLAVASKKTDVESVCSSDGSEDKEMSSFSAEEYCSRNRHSFKFTDKGNTTPCVNSNRKIKLKRPVISDVAASDGTGPQCATERKLIVDCDIISIYADTIANDADERAFDSDAADKGFVAKPPNFVSDWLQRSATPPVTDAIEPPAEPAAEAVPAKVEPQSSVVTEKPVEKEPSVRAVQRVTQPPPCTTTDNVRNETVALRPPPAVALPVRSRQPSEHIFNYMCGSIKRVGMCRKLAICRYQHTFPIGWEATLQSMSKESLLNLYSSVKRDMSVFLFKKIFATVAKQLGTHRDFISVVSLVKDVLEININSDRTPFIKHIIDALGTIGLTYQSTVEVIFNSTSVDTHLKDLLTDILITITVEQGHFERNWSAMQVLVKHRNFDVDNGIVQATLMECMKEGLLQKELCLKVYNDLLSHVSDDKLKTIFASLLRDYIECMRRLGLVAEAGVLYDRCAALALLPACSTPSSCSIKSMQSMKSVSDASPFHANAIGDQNPAKSTRSPLNNAKMSSPLAGHTGQPNAGVPARKPVVNKVPPWSNAHSNLFLKDAALVKRNGSPCSSAHVAPYAAKWPDVELAEVKRAIYAADFPKLMALIVQYKEGPLTDQFLMTCIESMQQSVPKFASLFNNMCQSVALIQKTHDSGRDTSLEYVFKTLGTNLIVYCAQQDKWEQAHTVYRTLCGLYKETDILNVKMLIDDKPSYIKRSLILSRICIKAGDFKRAWWLFKENRLLLTGSWDKDLSEQDVEYKNTVFTEFLAVLNKSKQWPVAFGIVEYVLTHGLNELYAQVSNLILAAINNECHVDYIISFMNVCPEWHQRVHKTIFRTVLIKVMKCGLQGLTQDLYNIGCEMNIYQSLFGNEKCIEISTHFTLEEIQLMLNILLTKMLSYMPIEYPVVLTVKHSSDIVDDTCAEVPNLLYQGNITCETMRVRIVNILNNYLRPPIMVINQNNQLIITPEQLHKHLTVRCRTNDLY